MDLPAPEAPVSATLLPAGITRLAPSSTASARARWRKTTPSSSTRPRQAGGIATAAGGSATSAVASRSSPTRIRLTLMRWTAT